MFLKINPLYKHTLVMSNDNFLSKNMNIFDVNQKGLDCASLEVTKYFERLNYFSS